MAENQDFDIGLLCLVTLGRFHRAPIKPSQLSHQFKKPDNPFDSCAIQLAAKSAGLKCCETRFQYSGFGSPSLCSLFPNVITPHEKQVIKSPVNGVVQELDIHTVGGIVTAAQLLMKIVPQSTRLEVEAMLANRDIGFVYRGQPAEIKVSAFPFTEYGVIHADVVGLSDAAIPDEKAGWLFKMRLEMEQETIGVNGKDVRLRPGMEVIAEVKTGTRSMMDYFLSPIRKSVDESLQER